MAANNCLVLPRPVRWRPACVAGALWACAGVALADAPADRARIQAQQQRLDAAFTAETAACRERFAVTACVDEVRLRRRDALAPLRAQTQALDEAELSVRASARRQALKDKQGQRAPGKAASAVVEAKPRAAPAASVTRPETLAPLVDQGSRQADAAHRAQAARAQQARAVADQEKVRQRLLEKQAQRLRKGGPAAPLPAPAAASGS